MKILSVAVICLFSFFCFSFESYATGSWYDEIRDSLPSDTRELLEDFGIDDDIYENYSEVSVEKALKSIADIFKGELKEPLKQVFISLSLILISTLFFRFLPENSSISLMGKTLALMCIMFSLVSVSGQIFTQCCSVLLVMKDFMLVLIPIFAGIVSFNGNASLALSFNSIVFSFAQFVVILFENVLPVVSCLMSALCTAGSMNPVINFSGLGKTVSKAVNFFMAFIAGIFVAVLSVRGVIAGAADTVGIRGVRFLIGNTVPIVGSALGEALNSIVASLGLIKNTVGAVAIAAIAVIALPVLIKASVWKGALYFIGLFCDIFKTPELKSFCENLSGVFSVILGAVLFSGFVFILSIAILLTLSRS